MYLLDTVTLSNSSKIITIDRVQNWLDDQSAHTLFTSTLCIGELRYGVERLPPGQKRDALRVWIEEKIDRLFSRRVIAFDGSIAKTWAELRAQSPRTLPIIDSLIAATALNRNLTIVTRNTKDFEAFGVEVFNPWVDN